MEDLVKYAMLLLFQSLNRVQIFFELMNYSLPDSSVHGISQARILEWVAISFSRASSRPRNGTRVSCLAGGFFTAEPPESHQGSRFSPCSMWNCLKWCYRKASVSVKSTYIYFFKICTFELTFSFYFEIIPNVQQRIVSLYLCRRGRRQGFYPWVGKIPWRRKWQPTPVFLPGKPCGQRSLAGRGPGVAKSQTWPSTATAICIFGKKVSEVMILAAFRIRWGKSIASFVSFLGHLINLLSLLSN